MKGVVKEIRGLFIAEMESFGRPGFDKMLGFMNKKGFFDDPASRQYHLAFKGGLVLHSWNVYQILKRVAKKIPEQPISPDKIFLCGALHDLCKMCFYGKNWKWYKGEDTNNRWTKRDVWKVEDQYPLGHGEKTLFIIQQFIKVSVEEACALRWHMGYFDPGAHFFFPSGAAINRAWEQYPLARVVHIADMMSALTEKELAFHYKGEWHEVGEEQRFTL